MIVDFDFPLLISFSLYTFFFIAVGFSLRFLFVYMPYLVRASYQAFNAVQLIGCILCFLVRSSILGCFCGVIIDWNDPVSTPCVYTSVYSHCPDRRGNQIDRLITSIDLFPPASLASACTGARRTGIALGPASILPLIPASSLKTHISSSLVIMTTLVCATPNLWGSSWDREGAYLQARA